MHIFITTLQYASLTVNKILHFFIIISIQCAHFFFLLNSCHIHENVELLLLV